MTTRPIPLLIALLLSASAGARAADSVPAAIASPAPEPRTGIGLDVGIGSALGELGVTLTESVGRVARLELGAGVGVSGYQLSFMPKIALGQPHDHFVAGVGLSVAFPDNAYIASGHPIWLNVDAVGYEHHFDNGIAVSSSVGLTGGLGGGQICLPPDGCEPQFFRDVTHYWGPQARAQLAYWF
jgi:hypothetical protein